MTDIDITDPADTLTLSEACRVLPRGRRGARPHLSTLIRWITTGAPAPDGTRVRLSAIHIGGKWITSRAALQDFAAALTPQLQPKSEPMPRTPAQRRRASDEAARELKQDGI